MSLRSVSVLAVTALFTSLLYTGAGAQHSRAKQPISATPLVKPKPIDENVKRGLTWLIRMQHENGGWSQGEEAPNMGGGMPALRDKPNVADTCIATLALMQAGSTPSEGEHARAVRKAVDFISSEIEKSDLDSLYITNIRGTRVQSKLGTYIDTFLSAMVLADVKGRMLDQAENRRVLAALDKVMNKIEKNQQADGTWDNQGWAPVLAQSMGSKALNRAAQAGAPVSEQIRAKAEVYARKQFDKKSGRFGGEGAAGVELYSSAGNLGAMQDSENTNRARERDIRIKLKNARNEQERQAATRALAQIEDNRKDLALARYAVVQRMGDERFIQGFGSNGGEEFLSYMNIAETLVAQGGQEWEKWNSSMIQSLSQVQNQDGSWTGHHCITGRTFCTAAALLVLTVDRANAPVAARISSR